MTRNPLALVLVPALLAASAFAQTAAAPKIVGTVKNVTGLVTRSDAESATSVVPNTPVADGQRFVTSSNGSIDIDFNDGCNVPMGANSSITIDSSLGCVDRQKSISTVVAAAGVFGGGSGSLLGPTLLGASQLAGAALVARPTRGSASGSGQGGGIPTPPISGQ